MQVNEKSQSFLGPQRVTRCLAYAVCFVFYRKYVLQLGPMLDKPGEIGSMNWQLTLCLLLSWIIVFFCLMKGVKSSGKVG